MILRSYCAASSNAADSPAASCAFETPTDDPKLAGFLSETHDIWELLYMAMRMCEIGSQVIATLEPASLAKYAFGLAQRFNLFYHHYRILSETDPDRRLFYILVVDLVREALTKALDLMGIEVPRRM